MATLPQIPNDIDDNLKQYLQLLTSDLNTGLDNALIIPQLSAIPAKPVIGKIYYFSQVVGVITEIGYWGYKPTGWVQLG